MVPSLQNILVRGDFFQARCDDTIYLLVNIHDMPQRSRLGGEEASDSEILHDDSLYQSMYQIL